MPLLHPFARERTLLFVRGQALPDCNNAAVTTQISAEGGKKGFSRWRVVSGAEPWLITVWCHHLYTGGSVRICLYLGFYFLFLSLLVWCQFVSLPVGLSLGGADLLLAPASTFTHLQLSQGNDLTYLHKVTCGSSLAPENSLLDCLPHLFSSGFVHHCPLFCPVLCSKPQSSPAPRVRPLLSPALSPCSMSSLAS